MLRELLGCMPTRPMPRCAGRSTACCAWRFAGVPPAAGVRPADVRARVQVDVTVDDHAFSGDSPFLFGAVLEQFFARHVSINAFAECVLTSAQRGTLAHWPARIGRRPAI